MSSTSSWNDLALWEERYRPQTLQECILPQRLREQFQQILDTKDLRNLMFVGPAGTGKTTVARALARQLGMDVLFINGSENTGIDVLRTDIRQFASAASFTSEGKVVIIDEADYLNPNSTQPAFRAFVEEFASTTRFILCANYPSRLIPEIHSRFPKIDFTPQKSERVELAKGYAERVEQILHDRKIEVDKKTISAVVVKHFPDLRSIINSLQANAVNGVVLPTVLGSASTQTKLIKALRNRDFDSLRAWVIDRGGADASTTYRDLFDWVSLEVRDVAVIIEVTAEYQYKAAFVADQELNLLACLTKIMALAEWR